MKKNKRFSKGWFITNANRFMIAGTLLFFVTVSSLLIREGIEIIKKDTVVKVNHLENKVELQETLYDVNVGIYKLGFAHGYYDGHKDGKDGKLFSLEEKKDFINEEFKKSRKIFMQEINR